MYSETDTVLTKSDKRFLVALLASEEASVAELKSEFDAWSVKTEEIQEILVGLVKDGTIGVTNLINEKFNDFTQDESLALADNWSEFVTLPYQLFLTDLGYKHWDEDDWGITSRRAKFLIFSNKGN